MEFGNLELFITDVSGKYPRLWTLKGANPNDVRRWYNFGALTSICTIAPSFREISGLPDWKKKSEWTPPQRKRRHAESPNFVDIWKIMKTCPSTKKRRPLHHQLSPVIDGENRKGTQLLRYIRRAQKIEEISKIDNFTFFFFIVFCPLFLYSIVRKPEKYLRLKYSKNE
ncbi:hypothetical protein ACS0TY_004277 [Phlomoides rotata]